MKKREMKPKKLAQKRKRVESSQKNKKQLVKPQRRPAKRETPRREERNDLVD